MGGVQRGYRTCPVSDEAFRLLQQRAEDDEHSLVAFFRLTWNFCGNEHGHRSSFFGG